MDADLMAIIKLQPAFGKNANLVFAYCELFGIVPLKSRRKKLRLLLEEMKRLFDSESFTYQKTTYRIAQFGIADALNIVVHRHWTDRLENHNYLKKIMIAISEREGRTSGQEAEKALRKKEAALRGKTSYSPSLNPSHQGREDLSPSLDGRGQGRVQGEGGRLTDEQIEENKRRLRELTGGIKGRTS